MSLYHEAAEILTAAQKNGGSLKSLVFGKKTWKSDPKALFALTTETAKWSVVLSEVLEKSGVLKVEKNLTPTLAILLVHDLFLAKKGIALPATHGLNSSISRHKVRLSAELTKARLRRGFGTLDDLCKDINAKSVAGAQSTSNGEQPTRHPRWIRINTLKGSLDEELKHGSFSNFTQVQSLKDIIHAPFDSRLVHVDAHMPDLVAIATPEEPTTFKAYRAGKLILQEKASCFPAYLLDISSEEEGDVIDACAAPGNKTTHIAAIVGDSGKRVFACERDSERSKTLQKMVKIAGAENVVTVKTKQDFTRLDPSRKEFANVTGLILDPSCSGSGIFGRDEGTIAVHLPSLTAEDDAPRGKKRKRGGNKQQDQKPKEAEDESAAIVEETPDDEESQDKEKLQKRLENLSGFQLRIVKHAMSFPAAKKITYSTCSLHDEENEHVVLKALQSDIAVERGWRILGRNEQVEGMKRWHKRGQVDAVRGAAGGKTRGLDEEALADACIRCDKGGEDGTMGFFVAAFVRHEDAAQAGCAKAANGAEEDDEWGGFSDDES
ncbi:Putative SAM-dependent methyltransferase RsmB/NOP2-type, RNA (C5-cytosine) methyltransferase [Septoria linicola]|uniref:SAM-dependent methyltransferase RsmB/NOP2-type, RNA (C5-cytosine) methyltransferase n=1 Tax=Septoria linicola TaxID=215465 RepID=A0A9Q9ANU6_9PEZI|nr:putative SAM-dependent methyltransferase RsmB/NOP2-type, RNA (C5-cytosine) methyltransferase [Septoria linicola]USW49825.1 Putative SAM-dependent methyltransferase RsmB/NOP2-type, RNA (C5-cytosine) methyltransferase [Septoria linicola]